MKPVGRSTHGILRPVSEAARADWKGASSLHRVLLFGVVVAVTYEWGIGNEIVTPWLSTVLINQVDAAIAGVLIAAAAVALFTLVQQIAVGWTVLFALTLFPRLSEVATQSVHDRLGTRIPSWWELPRLQAVAVSFSLGGSFVAVEETLARATRTRRTIACSALTCAFMVFVIVGIVGSLVSLCAGTSLAEPTQTLMDVLSNPLPWLLVAITPFLAGLARRRFRSDPAATAPAKQPMPNDAVAPALPTE